MPNVVASFNMGAPVPIDKRMVKKNIGERNAIPIGERYEGLEVYCEEEQCTYKLKGGTSDECWVDELSDLNKNKHSHKNKDVLDSITKDVVDKAEKSEQSENKGKKGGYASLDSTGKVPNKEIPQEIARVDELRKKSGGYTWYMDEDFVMDAKGNYFGSLEECMNEDEFIGNRFYAVTTESDAGEAVYPEKYVIDGANGHLSLRDYVIWTGSRLVHIPTFEAKSSTEKNSDGKYSPKSGVDGLMSSTDKAYLTDLINSYWNKNKMTVFPTPDPADGWMVNWCREDGIYLGGIKKDCGGHPPVVNDNHTSWVIMVFNGMATDTNLNRNHRLQVALDVVNSKIYMRRGWMTSNTWADNWDEVGGGESQEITFHEEDALINWVSKTGVHFCHAQAGNGANPVNDTENLDYIIYTGKVFDGSNYTTKRFQEAVHVATGRTFYRTGEVAEGGSFGGFEWSEITMKSDGIITVTSDMAGLNSAIPIYLSLDTREVVVETGEAINIYMPKEQYVGWSCVINGAKTQNYNINLYIYNRNTDGYVELGEEGSFTSVNENAYMLFINSPYTVDPTQIGAYEIDPITKQINDTLTITEVGKTYELGSYKNIVVKLSSTPKSSDYVRLKLPEDKKLRTFNVLIDYPYQSGNGFSVQLYSGEIVASIKTHVYDGSTYCTCYHDGTEWLANMVTLTRDGASPIEAAIEEAAE